MIALLMLTWSFVVLIVLGVIAHGALTWARDHKRRAEMRDQNTTSIINRARGTR